MIKTGAIITLIAITLGAAGAAAEEFDYGQYEALFGEPVTTSATGSPQRLSETPVDMEIITAEDIAHSGADNVPDILRFVAGVDVRRYGFSDADVGIRGYNQANSPRVLVLINGRQVYIDFHSYTAWAALPIQIEEIRQIEVIKGPNAALFGFNAVGGVINIITFDPLYDKVNEGTVRVGTQRQAQGSAVSTLQYGDKAGLRLSAGQLRAVESSMAEQTTQYTFTNTNFAHQVSADGRLRIGADTVITGEFSNVTANQYELGVGGYQGTSQYQVDSEKLGLESNTPIGHIELGGYRNNISYTWDQGGNLINYTTMTSALSVFQASDRIRIGNDHVVRIGGEYRNNVTLGDYYNNEKLGFDLYSIDAMWNWQINHDLSLTNSARLDNMTLNFRGPLPGWDPYAASDYNGNHVRTVSYNSALVYQATPLDAFRLSTARGAQPPDLYEFAPSPEGTSWELQGSPHLKASLTTNYEVDYTRGLPNLNSQGQLAVYAQTTRDTLASPGDGGSGNPNIVNDSGTAAVWGQNIGNTQAVGGELTLKGSNSDGWRWKAAYALSLISSSLITNTDPTNLNSSLDFKRGTPANTLIAGIGRSWDKIDADLAAKWQSEYSENVWNSSGVLAPVNIQNYAFLSGHLGYKIADSFTLGLTGEQATVRRTTAGVPTLSRIFLSATFSY